MADYVRPTGPIQGPGETASPASRRAAASEKENPAFRVLLERLQEQAHELAEKSKGVDGAAELSGAVDVARASLDDALSLSDRLLEAYREAQYRPAVRESSGDEREEAS